MIWILIADTARLPDPRTSPEALQDVPVRRRESVLLPELLSERKLRLGAGLLLKRGLKRFGADAEKVDFTGAGKPFSEGICFSLTHSKEKAALAVSESEVGCDLEKIRSIPERVLKRFFLREREQLSQCRTEAGRQSLFFRLWTEKESYLKFTGEGVAKIFGVEVKEGEIRTDGKKRECCLKSYEREGYWLSVCSKREEKIELEKFEIMG